MRTKSFEKVVSTGLTSAQLQAVNTTAKKLRWTQASFNRYAIVKELIARGTYDPNQDPDNDEDYDDLILEQA